MENDRDLRSDKIIIIGFTGPIGSGCTEISKFLSNNDEFNKFLEDLQYINRREAPVLNVNILDDEIKTQFKNKSALEEEIIELTEDIEKEHNVDAIHELEIKKARVKIVHKEIKNLLERRRYIYSLEYLIRDDFYKAKLRISCSSIIVFELMRKINDQIKTDDSIKKEKVKKFRELLIEAMQENEIDSSFFQNIYTKLKDLYIHESKIKEIPPDHLPRCFSYIAKIKEKIKESILYRELMQDFGDNMRSTGNPYFYSTKECILENKEEFQSNNYIIGRYIDYLIHYYSNEKQTGMFLIDSLRNPMCIKYLRNRYPKFVLISLYANISKRIKRRKIIDRFFTDEIFEEQDLRDQGKDLIEEYDKFYKQNVRESVLISDIAINNEENFQRDLSNKLDRTKSSIFNKLLRYISLVVDPGCTKPTTEEMFMNMAYTMAMKSNCISRKVGAVIEGGKGYVVGAGWNDVGEGQLSCGLRYIKDLRLPEYINYIEAIQKKKEKPAISDEEIIKILIKKYGNENCCFCLKDELSKAELLSKLDKVLNDRDIDQESKELYKEIKEKLNIKRLEFCKALHAEENAIIQSAKIGGMGLKDAKIYVTTYPCELCAKKIPQAGIKEVIYVEPYPKVLSEDLYLKDGIQKVMIRQFEGVKAYGYMKLFKATLDQKDRQALEAKGFTMNVI